MTADGDLWQKQRLMIGPALRTDMLDEIIPIAKRATDRLCKKLETYRGTGKALNIEEEFRLLTLQVSQCAMQAGSWARLAAGWVDGRLWQRTGSGVREAHPSAA